MREEFTVGSWLEFQRQSTDRWTRSDQDAYETAASLTMGSPTISHYFPIA